MKNGAARLPRLYVVCICKSDCEKSILYTCTYLVPVLKSKLISVQPQNERVCGLLVGCRPRAAPQSYGQHGSLRKKGAILYDEEEEARALNAHQ